MNDDERARVEAIKDGRSGYLIHDDTGWLLALVERQEAEISRLVGHIEGIAPYALAKWEELQPPEEASHDA